MNNEFFDILFDNDEFTCFGNRFATKVSSVPPKGYHEFFCINTLSPEHDYDFLTKEGRSYDVPRRADLNVNCFRNFMYEMDSVGLEDQLRILTKCGIPWSTIVYSGGKSYHAILSLETPLEADYHSYEGVASYKTIWSRIAAYIDEYALANGFKNNGNTTSFVDKSSKNPSRLSRFPMTRRDNGNIQAIISLGKRISDREFVELVNNCPEVSEHIKTDFEPIVDCIETVADFWRYAPIGLKNQLRYVDWADDAGLYPKLYRLTLWAIDSTGVDKETFIEALSQRTFDILLDHGYPASKLTVAIDHAYKVKRRS